MGEHTFLNLRVRKTGQPICSSEQSQAGNTPSRLYERVKITMNLKFWTTRFYEHRRPTLKSIVPYSFFNLHPLKMIRVNLFPRWPMDPQFIDDSQVCHGYDNDRNEVEDERNER